MPTLTLIQLRKNGIALIKVTHDFTPEGSN